MATRILLSIPTNRSFLKAINDFEKEVDPKLDRDTDAAATISDANYDKAIAAAMAASNVEEFTIEKSLLQKAVAKRKSDGNSITRAEATQLANERRRQTEKVELFQAGSQGVQGRLKITYELVEHNLNTFSIGF